MNKSIMISGNILKLVIEMGKEGHIVSVSGNSHTSIDVVIHVRSPKERGNIACIRYLATSSYGYDYTFKRKGVKPAFSSVETKLEDYVVELDVKALVADANCIRENHLNLKGVQYVERAARAVSGSHLMQSAS